MERTSDRLYDCGARHFVLLNGHGGNTHALSKVCRHLYKKGAVGTIFDWWTIAGKINPKYATYEWGKEMVEATADFLVEYMKEFQKM